MQSYVVVFYRYLLIFTDITQRNNFEVNDGVIFLAESIRAVEIRADANYAGVRVTLLGMIENARCQIQIDIGFGDAVTPGAENADYPVMLSEFEASKPRVYPRYTVVAEEFEALIALGIANSRLKDYFDPWTLSQCADFESDILRQSIQATCNHRGTHLTKEVPFGLTDAFA